nr:hypothetical protein GCM10020093_008930 [Planobispora longispora]
MAPSQRGLVETPNGASAASVYAAAEAMTAMRPIRIAQSPRRTQGKRPRVRWSVIVSASHPAASSQVSATDHHGNSAIPANVAPCGAMAISVTPLGRNRTRQIFGPRSRPLMIANAVARAWGSAKA